MNDRQDYEPFNADNLIANLNVAWAAHPHIEACASGNPKDEEKLFLANCRAYDAWQRDVWTPAREALRDAGIEVKFDYASGQYFAKYDADGRERFTVRVSVGKELTVLVSADDEEDAKKLAVRAANRESKTAKHLKRRARWKCSTKAEIVCCCEKE